MVDPLAGPEDSTWEWFEVVANWIRSSGVKPGGRVPSEAALATALGAGRPRVREALTALEALGALEVRQGARRVWLGFDPARYLMRAGSFIESRQEIGEDLLEIRHALETAMLPKAAGLLTSADLKELRAIGQKMVERARAGEAFTDLDQEYHRRLFAHTENAMVDMILQFYWEIFRQQPLHVVSSVESLTIAQMHVEIIDALYENDVQRATHELASHFYGVRNQLPTPAGGSVASAVVSTSALQ